MTSSFKDCCLAFFHMNKNESFLFLWTDSLKASKAKKVSSVSASKWAKWKLRTGLYWHLWNLKPSALYKTLPWAVNAGFIFPSSLRLYSVWVSNRLIWTGNYTLFLQQQLKKVRWLKLLCWFNNLLARRKIITYQQFCLLTFQMSCFTNLLVLSFKTKKISSFLLSDAILTKETLGFGSTDGLQC